MTQTQEETAGTLPPASRLEQRHTSFSVVDILSPTKFNGGLSSAVEANKSGSIHSQDHSEHELSGKSPSVSLLVLCHCFDAYNKIMKDVMNSS